MFFIYGYIYSGIFLKTPLLVAGCEQNLLVPFSVHSFVFKTHDIHDALLVKKGTIDGICFRNPILFAVCTTKFSKLCTKRIQWYAEECSVALLCN
jgi:hypothetical protein